MSPAAKELAPAQLCRRCEPGGLPFQTTEELEDVDLILGQKRAVDAIRFGIGISRDGYNLFAMGPEGVGRHTLVRRYLELQGLPRETPPDWCYVFNFETPHKPRALKMPTGRAVKLRQDMARLVDDLRSGVSAAFESDEHKARIHEIETELSDRQEAAMEAMGERAKSQQIVLVRTPAGFGFAPRQGSGVMTPDEFRKLSEEEQKRIEKLIGGFQEELEAVMRELPKWRREAQHKVRDLNRELVHTAVTSLIDELKVEYQSMPPVQEYLAAVQNDVLDHGDLFRQPREGEQQGPFGFVMPPPEAIESALHRYQVNVLIGHAEGEATPLVYEDNPTHDSLVGRAEHEAQMGALVTDFTLIKVAVDFEEDMERRPETDLLFARMIATLARQEKLRPLDRQAVARVIEHGSRSAGDAEKVSVQGRDIVDLLRESDYWAGTEKRAVVSLSDVQRAVDARVERAGRIGDRLREQIERGTLLIDTSGERAGQVNGLSVMQLGEFSFGMPHRITARVRLGAGKVVDIEREVELGGRLHSKGVLILSGFLAGRYATNSPLSLAASLVFEQSYGGVDGDSASSAELYALLSALADAPLKQSLAVTGSVNQHGEIQAIGGVNEKIEGFFDVCRTRGLTGAQGVLIPAANVKHLMLRRDVVDAVAGGRFHVYPVATVDQGIEILTGIAAGERGADGRYPDGSINARVEHRLAGFADRTPGARLQAAARAPGRVSRQWARR